ncbi:hydroxysqualene dehydroxylase HpnE [Frankia nepalensis]|uniref:FAD-dependent oxidoreductase n=1 Tax=Frankia nepalensis TaxID=1836974 RepID=A0A937RUW0_9ACTN|nr:hydroxysqualene dehydroxylase HpnE [Frankia nepalensis]MBL7497255.1 FAD-dependent oxidoreductase [Frankia nepalensis]MBL7515343.1 FAD-dependent oxidoreductase [Frankia nepalensis]MBL7632321.1 FAD-dependent oxidoreductase [Frankia nepalensis]
MTGEAREARPRVAIVGGGLAGLSAALLAADSGADVVLLEARPRLGGATASFDRKGLWVDTGQHVFMRCCTAYRGFLQRLGVEHLTTLQPRLDVEVLLGDRPGQRARLRRTKTRLPAPLHLAPALLGYKALPVGQRAAAALAAFQLGRLDQRSPAVDGASFGSWLGAHRQGPVATEALWELLTIATLNAPAAEASLGLAAKVVRTGLLERADAADLGWADVPLQELHGEAAAKALADAGADVRTSVKVREITRTEDGYRLVTTTGGTGRGDAEVLTADAVVLAVPPSAAAALMPAGAHPDPASLEGLGASPIVNIHMIFDRKVIDGPFLAVTSSPIQWIFDRTDASGLAATGKAPAGAQYVALSQSAAEPWVDRPAGELGAEFVAEMRRILPAARDAELIEVFVTRERTATFRQAPGSLALRPAPATGLPGFALAGAWTDTGWPATMEGAVRSGLAAARETLASVGVNAGQPATASGGASRRLTAVSPARSGGAPSEHPALPAQAAPAPVTAAPVTSAPVASASATSAASNTSAPLADAATSQQTSQIGLADPAGTPGLADPAGTAGAPAVPPVLPSPTAPTTSTGSNPA